MKPECTSFLDVCLLPKKGYSYFKAQSLSANKAYTYELNLVGGVTSMTLKLSSLHNIYHSFHKLHYMLSMQKASDIHSLLGLHHIPYIPLYLTHLMA